MGRLHDALLRARREGVGRASGGHGTSASEGTKPLSFFAIGDSALACHLVRVAGQRDLHCCSGPVQLSGCRMEHRQMWTGHLDHPEVLRAGNTMLRSVASLRSYEQQTTMGCSPSSISRRFLRPCSE